MPHRFKVAYGTYICQLMALVHHENSCQVAGNILCSVLGTNLSVTSAIRYVRGVKRVEQGKNGLGNDDSD
jgi:hypothetical protein